MLYFSGVIKCTKDKGMLRKTTSSFFTFAILCLAGVLLPITSANAQSCMYPTDIRSPVFCYDTMMSGNRLCMVNLHSMTPTASGSVYKYWNCAPQFPLPIPSPTNQTGLSHCSYIMGQRRLYGKRPKSPSVTMAFCQITCDCGTLRMDESHGLPVELLEFGVDDE